MNSVHITQDPTYLNVSHNPMVFVVSGSNIDEFQYQYVLDVRTFPDNTLRTRIKQYRNPSGVAVFDVSHVVNDYIEFDTDNFKLTGIKSPLGTEYRRFQILAGEEYGTSASSSVTLYNGTGGVGAPGVSGSSVLNGVYSAWGGSIDYTPGKTGTNGWNWGDYFGVENTQYLLTSNPSSVLGASPTNHKIGRNDYSLLPILDSKTDITVQNTRVRLYDENNSLVASANLNRTLADRYINYIPAGPQNFIDAGLFTQTQINNTKWYRIDNVATTAFNKSYTIEDCSSNYERRNFLFINKWGLWDSYGMNTPLRQSTNITRDEYKKPNIPYSSLTAVNDYGRRGFETYNQMQEDRFVITTPFLRDEEAKLVGELIESPQVYLQYNTLDMGLGQSVTKTFLPVQITNSSYTHKTSNLQKIVQYDIEYKLANPRPNR